MWWLTTWWSWMLIPASYTAEGGQGCKSGVCGCVPYIQIGSFYNSKVTKCTSPQLQNRQILLSSGNARHTLPPFPVFVLEVNKLLAVASRCFSSSDPTFHNKAYKMSNVSFELRRKQCLYESLTYPYITLTLTSEDIHLHQRRMTRSGVHNA